MYRALTGAVARTNAAQKSIYTTFWGANQRFFMQLCIASKVQEELG